jgi:RNA polymerase sigma-70 factor (ECF subfamily)
LSYDAASAALKAGATEETTGGDRPSLVLEDDALVGRAQEGNRWAVEELVRRYQDRAFAIAFHLCSGDRDEAQDVIQEAFLRVFSKLGTFQRKSSFYTWFYRIVVNVSLDRKRRRWRWDRILFRRHGSSGSEGAPSPPPEQPDRTTSSNPAELLQEKQLNRDLQAAMATLSEKQRTVFQLKVLHGLTIPEISEILGSAEGTVKSHLFRATQFLRQALKEWAEP